MARLAPNSRTKKPHVLKAASELRKFGPLDVLTLGEGFLDEGSKFGSLHDRIRMIFAERGFSRSHFFCKLQHGLFKIVEATTGFCNGRRWKAGAVAHEFRIWG